MALGKGDKDNFNNIIKAAKGGQLALIECTDAKTGKPVATLVFVNHEDDGGVSFVPVARLFDDNPYEQLIPPNIDSPQDISQVTH